MTIILDAPLLALAMTGCTPMRAQVWAPVLQTVATTYELNETPERLADFIAQIGHESLGLALLVELWGPKQVPAQVTYERDPLQPWGPTLKPGDRNYKAYTLGNSQPGDGFRFRGRGPIQRTGRDAAIEVRDELRSVMGVRAVPDFEAAPQLLENPQWGAWSAGQFWDSRHLNDYCDQGDFIGLTKRINGGVNGLADRQARRARAQHALGVN